MDRLGFESYLKNNKNFKKNTIQNHLTRVSKIDSCYKIDLSTFVAQINLANKFVYTKRDLLNNKPFKNKIVFEGDPCTINSSYKNSLLEYYKFYNSKIHSPAKFTGTKEEFENLMWPILTNLIRQLTAPYKKSIEHECELCKKKGSIQAAHQHKPKYTYGKERVEIVYDIIDRNYPSNNGVYSFDINDFLFLFIKEHMNINKTFFFLCPSCHNRYDDDKNRISRQDISKIKSTHNSNF